MAAYRTHINTWNTTAGNHTAVITPAVGDLFVVLTGDSGTGSLVGTVTDNNGGTYVNILKDTRPIAAFSGVKNASADNFCAFIRDSLVPNTTSTTVTHAPGTTSTGGGLTVIAISGMSRWGLWAMRQVAGEDNQTSGHTPAPSFGVAALTGNMTIAYLNAASASNTEPTGWTERVDVMYLTPSNEMEIATRDSGFTGTTVTWGSAPANTQGDLIIELDNTQMPPLPHIPPMPPLLAQ